MANAKTLSTANTIYVLDGTFTETHFTFDAENITLIGSGATTSLQLHYTENAKNVVVYECQLTWDVPVQSIYGDVSYMKCTINNIRLAPKSKNINLTFDNCTITGTDAYGIYIVYGDDENSNGCNLSVSNCSFSAIRSYTIFLLGNSSVAKFGNIDIANNQFIGGWGSGEAKRAVLKLHQDTKLCPVSYDGHYRHQQTYKRS